MNSAEATYVHKLIPVQCSAFRGTRYSCHPLCRSFTSFLKLLITYFAIQYLKVEINCPSHFVILVAVTHSPVDDTLSNSLSTYTRLSPSITHSLFDSRLKTYHWHKLFPPWSASTHRASYSDSVQDLSCSTFLPRDAMRKRGLCCRPASVTLVHCIQMAEDTVKRLSRPGSLIILVFWSPVPVPNSKGNPFSEGVWENFAIFDWYCRLSQKRYEISPWLLRNVNRKSYTLYGMVTFSMTLTDP